MSAAAGDTDSDADNQPPSIADDIRQVWEMWAPQVEIAARGSRILPIIIVDPIQRSLGLLFSHANRPTATDVADIAGCSADDIG